MSAGPVPSPRERGLSLREPGAIVVVSCYELGRQPGALAGAVGALEAAGFAPRAIDVSLQKLDAATLQAARLVAISVPMHTALRLGTKVAARVREGNPQAQVVFFGLYAALNRAHLLEAHADAVVGDVIAPLVRLAQALDGHAETQDGQAQTQDGQAQTQAQAGHSARGWLSSLGAIEGVSTRAHLDEAPPRSEAFPTQRRGLLPLKRYGTMEWKGESRLVAASEGTRGCKHLCRHCPIVPVWKGRFVAVPVDGVMADLAQQIDAGARHVSFADPDFLNGPTHALRLARALHARWPEVTFDATIKVEHLLKHADVLPELARSGGLFVISAVESLNDRVLLALDKGHVAADVARAARVVRAAGMELKPTLMPFTPWTTLADLPALFDFAEANELVENIEPVQYTLRLLLPPGSAVVANEPGAPWLRELVPGDFGHRWVHEDARVDALQKAMAQLASRHAHEGVDDADTFEALRALVDEAVQGRPHARVQRARREVPRLSEPWFCCAEPTEGQLKIAE
ncbi:MAG: radical SAM protein [Deltaproteobacteria bacterium]|nr:radical SAM protein [Deltaproteobacteria bacterium]